MMSIAAIVELSDQAAVKARKAHKIPFIFDSLADVDRNLRRIPNLGSYVPEGWKLEEYWTVNKDGSSDGGPALSLDSLRREITTRLDRGFALIEEGEFQVVVGAFRKL